MSVQKQTTRMIVVALVFVLGVSLQAVWTKSGKDKTEYETAVSVKSTTVSGIESVSQGSGGQSNKVIIIRNQSKSNGLLAVKEQQKTDRKGLRSIVKPSSVLTNGNKSNPKSSRGDGLDNPNSSKSYYKNKVVTLIYHHISNQSFSGITIKPERFEEDLKMLRDKGFNVIPLSSLIKAMQGNFRIPENAVVITFDDGISSLYTYGFPILKKYNVPVASFLVTSRNESYSSFKTPDSPLSPEQITTMARSGLVEFESHSNHSHERVTINAQLKKGAKLTNRIYDKTTRTYETEEEYISRITDDLTTSSDLIAQYTGRRATVLCFPFGIYDKQLMEIAEACGYHYFVTTQYGVNYGNSPKNKIYRIRAGDAEKTSEILFKDILAAAR